VSDPALIELIEIEGEPFPRGRQYGVRAAGAIRQNATAYRKLIAYRGGLQDEAATSAALAYAPILEAHAPAVLEEMRGIADGAGCSLADVLLINARSELMTAPAQGGECTALAATSPATTAGQVLLGQNWDWYSAVESEPVLLRIRRPAGPEIMTLAEAGQVAKIGLNSAGLGVCLNFLEHAHRGQGLPIHVLLRLMLESDTLGVAAWQAYRHPRAGAANVLLAHAEGDILDLELTARAADHLYGDAGWLVHANHFDSPLLRGGDAGLVGSPSTLARAARARRLMAAQAGGISLETLQAILRDHAYGYAAICRHPDPTLLPEEQTETRASLVMELADRRLHLSTGRPCQGAVRAFSLWPAAG
jgi:isopenicillin-N N-acyltransferase-like protein